MFQKAAQLGIHRAVHAGFNGPPENIMKALDLMNAERIVEARRAADDERIYQHIKDNQIHLEMTVYEHNLDSIERFARDGVSFSISTADPTIDNTTLQDKYEMLLERGVTVAQIQQAVKDAVD